MIPSQNRIEISVKGVTWVLLGVKGLICIISKEDQIKDTKRIRVKLHRNVTQCSRQTINVISTLHECKKVCLCTKVLLLSGSRARIKQGWRKRSHLFLQPNLILINLFVHTFLHYRIIFSKSCHSILLAKFYFYLS